MLLELRHVAPVHGPVTGVVGAHGEFVDDNLPGGPLHEFHGQDAHDAEFLSELDGISAKQNKLDLSPLLQTATPHPGKALYCTEGSNPPFDHGLLNKELLAQAP